jgi:ABC-type proline/glycine betaine transport system ATPase subunit
VSVDGEIFVLLGLSGSGKQVAALISRIHLSLEDLETLMYASERTSYKKAAADCIATHKKQMDYWVIGKR